MSEYAQKKHLARIAGDIIFSDHYMDLLESTYSDPAAIREFEANPKHFLRRHGIHIPDAIDVVIHDPGELGRPARVDFHWGEWVRNARSDKLAARQKLRELAQIAGDVLLSREMTRLREKIQASGAALKKFALNPKPYAAAQNVEIPDGMDLVLHQDDPNDIRIDIHFRLEDESVGKGLRPQAIEGCCYCSNGNCCYYIGGPMPQ